MSHSRNREEVVNYFINRIFVDHIDIIKKDLLEKNFENAKKRLQYIIDNDLKEIKEEIENTEKK